MDVILYSSKIDEYLKCDSIIDYDNNEITETADMLFKNADNELDFIKRAYEFVRDNILHSADINEDIITFFASQVLAEGHGNYFAKSHLFAALLRCKSVPVGFCYQKLILDDETAPVMIYHGLNGVYIREYNKWIRLDARGNKEGVNTQFKIDNEQLVFPIRIEKGEEDGLVIYPSPDVKVLEQLKKFRTRSELWNNLPIALAYNK